MKEMHKKRREEIKKRVQKKINETEVHLEDIEKPGDHTTTEGWANDNVKPKQLKTKSAEKQNKIDDEFERIDKILNQVEEDLDQNKVP